MLQDNSGKTILLSLGSNHNAERNMFNAQRALCQLLHHATFTPCIYTAPYHSINVQPYLNSLVRGLTIYDYNEIDARLKDIEAELGRIRHHPEGIVSIDIDILQLGEQRYHPKDWEREYVTRLLGQPFLPMTNKGMVILNHTNDV